MKLYSLRLFNEYFIFRYVSHSDQTQNIKIGLQVRNRSGECRFKVVYVLLNVSFNGLEWMLAVGMKWNPSWRPGLAFVFYLIEDIWWYKMNLCAWAELGCWMRVRMFCGLKVFLVIADRGADGGSESRAEGEGRKLRGAGAVRDRGGDHSLPDGDDSLRGDRRRSFITRDPVHHCTSASKSCIRIASEGS